MTSNEIRSTFLAFMKERGHTVVPSASLVPENDPSVLFTTAGMQPLVPYLMGQPHPSGSRRITNSQKCVRTNDIEEVGDNTHLTFFEMLGNWSLGDYFKKEALEWSFELLTSQEHGFGLDPRRLYVTVFEGNEDAPRDKEAYQIWSDIFTRAGLDPATRIFFMDAEANWWSPGDNGPCGPDSEMFYDVSGKHTEGLTHDAFLQADDAQEVIEIWNDVFMEYEKKDGTIIGKLANQNVDTGSGLERVVGVVQGKDNVYDTDLFARIMAVARTITPALRSQRILSDHLRASVFLIADGVTPSNTDQGYILRRLLRRAILHTESRSMTRETIVAFVDAVIDTYQDAYPEVPDQRSHIIDTIEEELITKFSATLRKGLREFDRMTKETVALSGTDVFTLFSTFGFPLEMTTEVAEERGIAVDTQGFHEEMKKHQEHSRVGSEQKFKGGLADTSEATTRLHTAHHLLLKALQQVLGKHVHQRGSNITADRLRIDFSHPEKVTAEQLHEVERIVNEKIAQNLPVVRSSMPKDEAETLGAEHEFGAKYPDHVSVYSIGPKEASESTPHFSDAFSIEFCGGPHAEHTGELGHFSIKKEEASSAGVRRIKATLR